MTFALIILLLVNIAFLYYLCRLVAERLPVADPCPQCELNHFDALIVFLSQDINNESDIAIWANTKSAEKWIVNNVPDSLRMDCVFSIENAPKSLISDMEKAGLVVIF